MTSAPDRIHAKTEVNVKVQAVATSVGVRSVSREKAARVVSCHIPDVYLDNQ